MKPPFHALIVDDEALDRELLNNLISTYCTEIKVVGQAANANEALSLINLFSPDVLFLDINMPNTNGFALLEQLHGNRSALVIFTTGYDEYGIKAIKAGAFDYLLKPIDLDELQACEKKIVQTLYKNKTDKTISFFHHGERHLIKISDIIYLEAQGSYTAVYTSTGKELLITKNLSSTLTEINSVDFVRIHRSYVVNLKHIVSYQWTGNEGLLSLTADTHVKVGRKFKANLKKYL